MTDLDNLDNGTALEKAQVLHSEDAVALRDHQTSAWKCAQKNPKVIFWALYANCQSFILGIL